MLNSDHQHAGLHARNNSRAVGNEPLAVYNTFGSNPILLRLLLLLLPLLLPLLLLLKPEVHSAASKLAYHACLPCRQFIKQGKERLELKLHPRRLALDLYPFVPPRCTADTAKQLLWFGTRLSLGPQLCLWLSALCRQTHSVAGKSQPGQRAPGASIPKP